MCFYSEKRRQEIGTLASVASVDTFVFISPAETDVVVAGWADMAGLEVLYTSVAGSITCPQDAVVCFVHWEMIKSGLRCVGSGDVVRTI